MAPCCPSKLCIWFCSLAFNIWVLHCWKFYGYTISLFYIFITISDSFPKPFTVIVWNPLSPLEGLGTLSLLWLYSRCPLCLECCFPPLVLQDKIQMYFLMKPFVILQIELIYHSIIIYFNNNNNIWVPICYNAILLIRMRFWGFMLLAQDHLVRFVWP